LGTRVGDSSFLVQIKGQEVPMHDPRGKLSMAVYYAMTPRGGNHMEGIHDPAPANPELGIGPVDRLGWENRAQVAGTYLNLQSFANSLILCAFTSSLAGTDYLFPCIREMLKASTGLSIDVQEMLKIGERNYGLLRLFAEREGYTRKDDDLPNRLKRALPDVGYAIEDGMLQRTIDDYYSLYDYKPYGPSNKRLRELLLEELIR